MLTDQTARTLATKIVKESSGVVKFNQTNGRICLHVRFPASPEAGEKIGSVRKSCSITLYSEQEWDDQPYPYNESKRPRKKRKDDDIQIGRDIASAIANVEAQ